MKHPSWTHWLFGLAVAAAALVAPALELSAKGSKKRTFKTASPPKFDQKTLDAFFPDAREKVGPGQPGGVVAAPSSVAASDDNEGGGSSSGGFAWSKLIGTTTLEDEVKAQVASLGEVTKTPSAFNGGGNHHARVYFTELALLFGVIADYDGDVRWKKDAAALRAVFGRAAANCKVSGDNAWKQAHKGSQDLSDLVTGGKIELPKPDPDAKCSDLVNRPPLMTRMGKEGYDPRLKAWTADRGEFAKNRNALLEEAQLVAAIAHMIQDSSYEFADDESYVALAKELELAATEVAEAVKADDFSRAQTAAGRANKACATCHEGYRGG